MRLPGYLRYMDDMVLFAETKAACWLALEEAERRLRDERGLELKAEATRLAPVTEGLPFLGCGFFRHAGGCSASDSCGRGGNFLAVSGLTRPGYAG